MPSDEFLANFLSEQKMAKGVEVVGFGEEMEVAHAARRGDGREESCSLRDFDRLPPQTRIFPELATGRLLHRSTVSCHQPLA